MTGVQSTESSVLALALAVILLVLYGDHLWNVLRQWRTYRDRRSFTHVCLALVAEMGMVAITVGRAYRLGLVPDWVSLAVTYALTGSLLTVGLYLVWSWRHPEPPI